MLPARVHGRFFLPARSLVAVARLGDDSPQAAASR